MPCRIRFVVALAALALVVGPAGFVRADATADLAAARQHRDAQRWAASESLATRALTTLEQEKKPDSLAMADALELIGLAHSKHAGYADGVGLGAASRALGIRQRRLGPNHLDVAAVHMIVSRYLQGTGRADSALVHAQRALAIRTQRLGAADTLVELTWDQIALIQRDRADMRAALDAWTRAIEIRRRTDGPESAEIAYLMAQTGVPWMMLGELERARAVLQGSLAMFARVAPDSPDRWIPLNILADVEKRRGNAAGNLDLLQEAFRIVSASHGPDSREAMTLRANMAVALSDVGDNEGAHAIAQTLLPLAEAQYGANSPRTLQLRLGLAVTARALWDTVTATAQLHALEAFAVAHGGQPEWLLSTALGQQAEILFWQRKYREALDLNARGIAIERASPAPSNANLALHHQVRVQILEAIGDTAALDTARRELARLAAQYPGTGQAIEYAYWGARAARRLGHLDETWPLAVAAESTSHEALRRNLQTLPDRRALMLTREQERYLELVVDLARTGTAAQRRTACDRLVRTRGLVRSEIARRSPPPGFAADTAIAGALQRRLETQRVLARMTTSAAARDSAGRARLVELHAAADDAEQTWARALRERGASVDSTEAGLDAVRARLKATDALVACYESGDVYGGARRRMVAFVVRAGDAPLTMIDLGSSDALRAALEPWLERLAASPGPAARAGGNAESECRRRGQAVRAATWDRLAPHLAGAQDVYLVADGPLADVAWQALPAGASRYLVETGPRLHLLNAERELVEPALPPSGSLLALGAPDYDLDGSRPPAAVAFVRAARDPCADPMDARLAPLPGSGAEAQAIARAWDATPQHEAEVLTGGAATEEALKRLAPHRTILHLATHGIVAGDTCVVAVAGARGIGAAVPVAAPAANARTPAQAPPPPRAASPWLSRRVWIALAGANRAREHTADENEGLLTAEEVVTLDLAGTDWVVLSACHSGLAERWSHEGTLGMRRAFDLAGARTVIASQWAIEDDATREWMEALYAARGSGTATAAAAMQSASRTVLAARRTAGRSTHPFYWAAFSATGE